MDKEHVYTDTPLPPARQFLSRIDPSQASGRPAADIPAKMRDMLTAYDYSRYYEGSHDGRNFYRQGKLMEDYEDDEPWDFDLRQYFPTYHKLSVPQLRGYFSWRTRVRRGEFESIAMSLAYLYIYELLSGIGTASGEEALKKLADFERQFLDSGVAESNPFTMSYDIATMRRHIHAWSLQYAVVKELPLPVIEKYDNAAELQQDRALEALRNPRGHSDEELFSALNVFAGRHLEASAFVKKTGAEGRRLFGGLWRHMMLRYSSDGRNLFTECFGRRSSRRWSPLTEAVYYGELDAPDTDVVVNGVRSYHRRDGLWKKKCYWHASEGRKIIRELVHEADRLFRIDRKTGARLKPKPNGAWATKYVETFLEEERRAAIEAAKPVIHIDFSELEQIRKDAGITRENLLTAEERADMEPVPVSEIIAPDPATPGGTGTLRLDDTHRQILMRLLKGDSPGDLIRENHLMESVVMDTINEALFDTLGDTALEYDGSSLAVVDDYRDEIAQALGGIKV